MHGAKMADGVYSVQTLIDRSPSCPAWWTQSSPSWTTYEGGKSSRGPSLVCEWLLGADAVGRKTVFICQLEYSDRKPPA